MSFRKFSWCGMVKEIVVERGLSRLATRKLLLEGLQQVEGPPIVAEKAVRHHTRCRRSFCRVPLEYQREHVPRRIIFKPLEQRIAADSIPSVMITTLSPHVCVLAEECLQAHAAEAEDIRLKGWLSALKHLGRHRETAQGTTCATQG